MIINVVRAPYQPLLAFSHPHAHPGATSEPELQLRPDRRPVCFPASIAAFAPSSWPSQDYAPSIEMPPGVDSHCAHVKPWHSSLLESGLGFEAEADQSSAEWRRTSSRNPAAMRELERLESLSWFRRRSRRDLLPPRTRTQ